MRKEEMGEERGRRRKSELEFLDKRDLQKTWLLTAGEVVGAEKSPFNVKSTLGLFIV